MGQSPTETGSHHACLAIDVVAGRCRRNRAAAAPSSLFFHVVVVAIKLSLVLAVVVASQFGHGGSSGDIVPPVPPPVVPLVPSIVFPRCVAVVTAIDGCPVLEDLSPFLQQTGRRRRRGGRRRGRRSAQRRAEMTTRVGAVRAVTPRQRATRWRWRVKVCKLARLDFIHSCSPLVGINMNCVI